MSIPTLYKKTWDLARARARKSIASTRFGARQVRVAEHVFHGRGPFAKKEVRRQRRAFIFTMSLTYSYLLCALCGTALASINDTVESNTCTHRWCTPCISVYLLHGLTQDGVTPTCNVCDEPLTDGLLRIRLILLRSGASRTVLEDIDVPKIVTMVPGANGAYLLPVRAENLSLPPLLRAFATEDPGSVAPVDAAYIAIGARARPTGPDGPLADGVTYIDAMLSGSEGEVTEDAATVLEQIMIYVHDTVFVHEKMRDMPRVDTLGEMTEVALKDRSLAHRLMHALAVGKVLPEVDSNISGRDLFNLLPPWVATEIFRKVRYLIVRYTLSQSDTLLSFN